MTSIGGHWSKDLARNQMISIRKETLKEPYVTLKLPSCLHLTLSFGERGIPKYRLSSSRFGGKRRIKSTQHLVKEKKGNEDGKLTQISEMTLGT